MTPQPTGPERARWFAWYAAHDYNVAATCRQFGIARSTFYRWQRRYDATHPVASLRRQAAQTTRRRDASKVALFFEKVLELSMAHPRWGRGRMRQELRGMRDDAPSEATIGRWLAVIAERCPVCGGSSGRHQSGAHALRRDLTMLELAAKLKPKKRKSGLNRRRAVDVAERILRKPRG